MGLEQYSIETMTLDDVEDILGVENLSFTTPWSKNAFELELRNNKNALYRVIKINGKAIAYGGMWLLFDESHITNIAVHPEYRGVGLGNMIMKDMINCCENAKMFSMTLEVRVSNTTAISLYKKYGFIAVATRKGYYQDTHEDAMIMWKYDV